MDPYLLIKTLHIVSSAVLFGTGAGIAFFMLRSWFTNNLQQKLYASQNTVLADMVFTLPAVIIQPISGILLIDLGGHEWTDFWLVLTYIIYVIAGLCWVPVVWIQMKLRTMVAGSLSTGSELPDSYDRLFRIWFILGWPAFIGLMIVFYLMVAKPT